MANLRQATVGSSSGGSVTGWIAQLKEGNPEAAEKLWRRYFQRLLHVARKKLGPGMRRAADEEDVALVAFQAICAGAAAGRFPDLNNRDNFWALLVCLTARRAMDLERHEARRGGNPSQAELSGLLAKDPTPEFAAMMAESTSRLLDLLKPALREVAVRKLEGRQNAEIAAELNCGLRTVERRLENIRCIWSNLL